jgi:hypothetical protein
MAAGLPRRPSTLIAALSFGLSGPARAEDPPVIAAASDLQFAVEEIAALQGVSGSWEKAIGVKEIRRLLSGEINRAECAELITAATRQYAKRQETWFRREKWLRQVEL